MVEALAEYIQRRHPNCSGFPRRNLLRMRQFYETYRGRAKVVSTADDNCPGPTICSS